MHKLFDSYSLILSLPTKIDRMIENDSKSSPKTLSLVEAVRKRPGMYFGNINSLALNRAIYEGIANSVDQYLAKKATKVKLEIVNDVIKISDDSSGLPFEKVAPNSKYCNLVEYYLIHRHDSPTADNHAPHIHIVGGGLGLAVLNAAAEKLIITSSNGSIIWQQEFGQGKITSIATHEKSDDPKGTSLEFKLDEAIFEGYTPDLIDLRKTLFELAHFYPGLIVEFQDEKFVAHNGLLDLAYIHYKNESCATDPPLKFFYEGKNKDVQLQIAAIGETGKTTEYISWVNGSTSIEGGTHIEGLDNVFKIANWNPKIALIHVIMHDPQFSGPSKDALRNAEVINIIKTLVKEPIVSFKNNVR